MNNESIVQDILALAPAVVHDIDGKRYTDKPLYLLPQSNKAKKAPDIMTFSTIRGLITVLKSEAAALIRDFQKIYICVKSPTEIEVTTFFRDSERPAERDTYLPYGDRTQLYAVKGNVPSICFGSYLSYEKAIIQLNAMFEKTPERDELLAALSSIVITDTDKVEDNGISQTVTMKKGVATKEAVVFKPIWNLRPYRSFIEATQAESKYLIRVNDKFEIGIFECDGGKWIVEAKDLIAAHISYTLKDLEPVLSSEIHVVA